MIKVFNEINQTDILAIGIHPDDVELSASGTVLKHIDKGYRVGICDLTKGELGSRGSARERLLESQSAAEILGVDWRVNLEMADGFSVIEKDHILQIAEIIRLCKPKIVLANALDDRHPDHPRGAQLAKEAFFFSGLRRITSIRGEAFRADSLFHYIQDKQLTPEFCVDISEYIDKKMESIKAFKTQFYQGEGSADELKTPISTKDFMEFMKAKMRVFGRPIKAEYAEGFNISRIPGVEDLTKLI